jgi:hypothetical protein
MRKIIIVCMSGVFLAACGGGSSTNPPINQTSNPVTPVDPVVPVIPPVIVGDYSEDVVCY